MPRVRESAGLQRRLGDPACRQGCRSRNSGICASKMEHGCRGSEQCLGSKFRARDARRSAGTFGGDGPRRIRPEPLAEAERFGYRASEWALGGLGAAWEAVGSGGRGTIAGQDDFGSARGCFGRPCGRKDSAVVWAISGRAKIPLAAPKRLAGVARPWNATAGDARGGKG